MSRFVCTGIIRKRIRFIIEADDIDEAFVKAFKDDWSDLDEHDADIEDWKLDPETLVTSRT
jgi:hypothetical protein